MPNGRGQGHERRNRKPVSGAFGFERTQLAGAVEDVSGQPTRIKADAETGSQRVNLWVWDTDRLEYVRQTFMDMGALSAEVKNLTKAVEKLTKAIEAM